MTRSSTRYVAVSTLGNLLHCHARRFRAREDGRLPARDGLEGDGIAADALRPPAGRSGFKPPPLVRAACVPPVALVGMPIFLDEVALAARAALEHGCFELAWEAS
jgi:hypothetical protein